MDRDSWPEASDATTGWLYTPLKQPPRSSLIAFELPCIQSDIALFPAANKSEMKAEMRVVPWTLHLEDDHS